MEDFSPLPALRGSTPYLLLPGSVGDNLTAVVVRALFLPIMWSVAWTGYHGYVQCWSGWR